MRKLMRNLALLISLSAAALTARAETVGISTVITYTGAIGAFTSVDTVTGPGFAVDFFAPDGSTRIGLCGPCAEGRLVSLDAFVGEGATPRRGSGTVNGVYYANLFVSPVFFITGQQLAPLTGGVVSGPVSLSGRLIVGTDSSISSPILSVDVIGRGTARGVFQGPSPLSILQSATYTIGEPIPEPATALLLGSGLAGLGVIRRKRRRWAKE